MCDRAVHGPALETEIMILGQAPGAYEGPRGRPFAHTAGKTLFQWLKDATGNEEAELREQIYFSAVARCFPGKAKSGAGDRVPSRAEIENCRPYWLGEVAALRPRLLLAVGRLAITESFRAAGRPEPATLEEAVGRAFPLTIAGVPLTMIPLPHPSGVSRWPKTEPGKTLLRRAVRRITREIAELENSRA